MKINKEKFEEDLIKHKGLISQIASLKTEEKLQTSENLWKIKKAKLQSRQLSLALSEFKCQGCQSVDRLSFHHLVSMRMKDYMPFDRWVTARTYWGNLAILCWKCHKECEGRIDNGPTENESEISKKMIDSVKRKYYGK